VIDIKTVREISLEIGVSKQAVFKKINNEPLKGVLSALEKGVVTEGGKVYISEEAAEIVREAFADVPAVQKKAEPQEKSNENDLKDYIEFLKHQAHIKDAQLHEKDAQIRRFQAQINDLNKQLLYAQHKALIIEAIEASAEPIKIEPVTFAGDDLLFPLKKKIEKKKSGLFGLFGRG
jgi:Zn finger protein HypA/HybF involved in hydrogenase expression